MLADSVYDILSEEHVGCRLPAITKSSFIRSSAHPKLILTTAGRSGALSAMSF